MYRPLDCAASFVQQLSVLLQYVVWPLGVITLVFLYFGVHMFLFGVFGCVFVPGALTYVLLTLCQLQDDFWLSLPHRLTT